jgi:hypothetical protein
MPDVNKSDSLIGSLQDINHTADNIKHLLTLLSTRVGIANDRAEASVFPTSETARQFALEAYNTLIDITQLVNAMEIAIGWPDTSKLPAPAPMTATEIRMGRR